MRINVTEWDIKNGLRCSSEACPIASAIYREHGVTARVGAGYVQHGAWGDQPFPLPPEARLFIQAFDMGREVRPFSFGLDVAGELAA